MKLLLKTLNISSCFPAEKNHKQATQEVTEYRLEFQDFLKWENHQLQGFAN